MQRFVDLTLNGFTFGVIYAAVALGLVLIWRATRVVNFAQGALAMFTTYIAVTLLDRSVNYWLAFVGALVAGLLLGAATERVFIRPLYGKPPLNPVVVSIGLLILVESIAGAIWGSGDRGFQPAFSQLGIKVGRTYLAFSHFDLFILAAVLTLMIGMLVLFRWTSLGLRMRASAFAPEVARLLGVRVGRILTAGWAFATFAGALAGLLVAPKVLLSPNMMDPILVYGFAGAVLGGLDSPLGALVGGVATGLGISYVGGYMGSSMETVGAAVLLIVVLSIRPEGIFSRPKTRQV
ncbi:MAG: branched-chain amino acid ABC transporter permease [Acidimicrobiales bacterium]